MALTVEDGTGLAGADSYVSEAEVEAYYDSVGIDRATWDALSSTAQEQTVRRAGRYLESRYRERFAGRESNRDQGMSFPRRGCPGTDGYQLDWNEIPDQLKWAQMELVLRTQDGTTLNPDVSATSQNLIRTKRQVGDLVTENEFHGGGAATKTVYSYVDSLLSPFLEGAPGVIPVVRS